RRPTPQRSQTRRPSRQRRKAPLPCAQRQCGHGRSGAVTRRRHTRRRRLPLAGVGMSAAAWLFLAAAIVAEVTGTLCLQLAVQQRKAWYAVVLGAYVAAFTLMSQALSFGMPLGIAYGV